MAFVILFSNQNLCLFDCPYYMPKLDVFFIIVKHQRYFILVIWFLFQSYDVSNWISIVKKNIIYVNKNAINHNGQFFFMGTLENDKLHIQNISVNYEL